VGFISIGAACGNQVLERVNPIGWHKLAAEFVIRGVQADRQIHLKSFVTEFFNFRDDADRTDRDPPSSKVEGAWVGQSAQGIYCRFVIQERLAHAHIYNIGQAFAFRLQKTHKVNNLGEHFSRGQAALVPHLPRRAKNAAHRAADLCGYAQGVALFVAHEHGLNVQAVGQPKQGFFGQLVLGAQACARRQGVERILLAQRGAQIAWNVGELRKVLIILLIKTAPDLPGAKRLLPHSR